MAFGRFSRTPQAQPVSSINVTPLVDVMLVLVVIFILAAPMLAASLRVQLPQSEGAKAAPPTASPSLQLELDAQGTLHVGTEAVDEAAVRQRLAALAAQDPQAELQLKADTAVPYGRVVEVMGWAHAAGLSRIGFVAQPVAGPTAAAISE